MAGASTDRSARRHRRRHQPADHHRRAGAGTRLPTVRDAGRASASARRRSARRGSTLAGAGAHRDPGPRRHVRASPRPGSRGPAPLPPRDRGARATSRSTCRPARPTRSCCPDLGPALARVAGQPLTTSYLDDPVAARPREALLRARWPFPPEALTVVDGAMDALDRITAIVVRLGDRVLVEHPAFPPLLDLLEQRRRRGRRRRRRRPGPRARRAAGRPGPPAGRRLPAAPGPQPDRREHRRRPGPRRWPSCWRRPASWVIEDDHAGDIATSPLVSLGPAPPGPHRAHAELLQEPRARPAPGRGRRRRRRHRRRWPTAACSGRAGRAACCRACWSSCSADPATVETVAEARDDVRAAPRRPHGRARRPRRRHDRPATGSTCGSRWPTSRLRAYRLATSGIGVAVGSPFVPTRADARPHPHHRRVCSGTGSGRWPTSWPRPPRRRPRAPGAGEALGRGPTWAASGWRRRAG